MTEDNSNWMQKVKFWALLAALYGAGYVPVLSDILQPFWEYFTAYMLNNRWIWLIILFFILGICYAYYKYRIIAPILKVWLPLPLIILTIFVYIHIYFAATFHLNVVQEDVNTSDISIFHDGYLYKANNKIIQIPIRDIIKCNCKYKLNGVHVFTSSSSDTEVYNVDTIDIRDFNKKHRVYVQNFVKNLKIDSPQGNYSKTTINGINLDIKMTSINNAPYTLHNPMWDTESHIDSKNEMINSQRLRMNFNNGDNFYSTMNEKIVGRVMFPFNKIELLNTGINTFAISISSKYNKEKLITENSMFKLVNTVSPNKFKYPKDIEYSDAAIKFLTKKLNTDSMVNSDANIDFSKDCSVSYIFKSLDEKSFSVVRIGNLTFRIQIGEEKSIECRDERNNLIKSDSPSDILEIGLIGNTKYRVLIDISRTDTNEIKFSFTIIDLKTEIQQGKINYTVNVEKLNDLHHAPFYIGARRIMPVRHHNPKHFFEVSTIEFY